ncbi:MAG: hypothetical protein WAX04_10335 [Oscillospiraceae bacterium]
MLLFEYLSFFLLIFTSLVGIFAIVKTINEWIFDDNTQLLPISILQIKEHDDRIEMLLRSFLRKTDGPVIIVDLGIDEEMLTIIQTIKGNGENVSIVKDFELQDALNEML